MRKIYLFITLLLASSNLFANNITLLNPCTNDEISIDDALSNKSILLNKKLSLGNTTLFHISYLEQDGSICLEKRDDLFFKSGNTYTYSQKFFNGVYEVYTSTSLSEQMFAIELEYGNGETNIEKYFLKPSGNNIYLVKKEIIHSRSGSPKTIKFKGKDIEHVSLSNLINKY